ncbi:MAG: hypothetical protein JWO15_3581 [Sphingomonadales bacterium]|nr:hypothetical protein [Sphingomonadales bacterium]
MSDTNDDLDTEESPGAAIMTPEMEIDPWEGLTAQQAQIQGLRFRGLTQKAIAQILNVSQPYINKQLNNIKEIHKERGTSIDQATFAGQTTAKFDLLEQKAWEIYGKAGTGEKPNTAVMMQALQTIAGLQEKKAKLLTDLGLLAKVAQKVEHSFKASGPTLVDSWESSGREQLAQTIIVSQMKALPEPKPPEEDIEDGEIEEETEES